MVAKPYYKITLSMDVFVPATISRTDALELLENWRQAVTSGLKKALEDNVSN